LAEEEKKNNIIAQLETSLGDCSTPVNDLLYQFYVRLSLEAGESMEDLRPVLEKEAMKNFLTSRWNHKDLIPDNEKIEYVESLLNILYLEGSSDLRGKKYFQPSGTRYNFSINQGLREKFLNLVAKKEDSFYTRDDDKVEKVWLWYKIDVLGVRSEKDTLVEKTIEELQKKIQELFEDILSSTDKADLKLLATLVSRENISDCIADITDDNIEECKKKLAEYQGAALQSLKDRKNSEQEGPNPKTTFPIEDELKRDTGCCWSSCR
jgi:hypothetical protein